MQQAGNFFSPPCLYESVCWKMKGSLKTRRAIKVDLTLSFGEEKSNSGSKVVMPQMPKTIKVSIPQFLTSLRNFEVVKVCTAKTPGIVFSGKCGSLSFITGNIFICFPCFSVTEDLELPFVNGLSLLGDAFYPTQKGRLALKDSGRCQKKVFRLTVPTHYLSIPGAIKLQSNVPFLVVVETGHSSVVAQHNGAGFRKHAHLTGFFQTSSLATFNVF